MTTGGFLMGLGALALAASAGGCNSDDSAGSAATTGAGGATASSTRSATSGPQSSSAASSTGAGGQGGAPNGSGSGGLPISTGAIGVGAGDNGGYPVPADCNTSINTPDTCIYCVKHGCCGAALSCLGDQNCVCWMSCMGQTDTPRGWCTTCGPPSSITVSLTDCAQSSCGLCKQQLLTCN
jgi:hypothetical protein